MILLAGVLALALAGCGKSDNSAPPQRVPVAVDMQKFRQAFASAAPDQQAGVGKVASSIRYGLS